MKKEKKVKSTKTKRIISVASKCLAIIFVVAIVGFAFTLLLNKTKPDSENDENKNKYTVTEGEAVYLENDISEEDSDYADNYINSVKSELDDKASAASTQFDIGNDIAENDINKDFTTQDTVVNEAVVYQNEDEIDYSKLEYGDIVYYLSKDDDGNESVFFSRKYPEMTTDKVIAFENKIAELDYFGFKRVTLITINGVASPVAESRYFFNATSKKVTKDIDGVDITNDVGFDVSKCDTSLDFLKTYLEYDGISSEFMTDDMSHHNEYQDTYSFDLDKCSIIEKMKIESGIVDVTKFDCSYILNKRYDSDVNPEISYILSTLEGSNSDGKQVTMYITYMLWYE